jgi:hypothetical protein
MTDRNDWAIALYKHFTAEIRFIKKQQWQLIYYTFLLESGLYFFSRNGKLKDLFAIFIIILLYCFIAYLSINLINNLKSSLGLNRKYLFKIKNEFSIGNLIGETQNEREEDISPEKDSFYIDIIKYSIYGSTAFFSILTLINGINS